MDDNFRNEYGEIVNKALLGVNDYYFSHIEELSDAFRESLQAACMQVKQMQKQGYPDVEYMEVTMLRTRFIQHDYRVPILVYGSDWYADLGQAQAGEIDAGGIFSFFEDSGCSGAGEKIPDKAFRACPGLLYVPDSRVFLEICEYGLQEGCNGTYARGYGTYPGVSGACL